MADSDFTPEELELLDEMIATLKSIQRQLTSMLKQEKTEEARFDFKATLNDKDNKLSNNASAGEKNSGAESIWEQKDDQLEDLDEKSLDLVHSKREVQVMEPLNNGGLVAGMGDQLLQPCVPINQQTKCTSSNFVPGIFISNCLLDLYTQCVSLVDAQKVLDEMGTRDLCPHWVIMTGLDSIEPLLAQTDELQLLLLAPGSLRLPPKPPDDASALIGENKIAIVAVFPKFSGEAFDNFIAVAEKLRAEYDFGHTLDAKHLPRGDSLVSGPAVRLFKPFDELFVNSQIFHVEALQKFVEESSTPVVTVFNNDPSNHPFVSKFFNSPHVKAMLFVNFTAEDAESLKSKYREAAELYKKEGISFLVGDVEASQGAFQYFGLQEAQAPLIIIQHNDGKKFLKTLLEPAPISTWLKEYKDGKVVPHVKSEPIPESNNEPVKVVVGKSLQDIVFNTRKNVLLEFYAPWCCHCKQLAPIFVRCNDIRKQTRYVTVWRIDSPKKQSATCVLAMENPVVFLDSRCIDNREENESTLCGWLFSARGWVPREKRPEPSSLELEVWGRKFSKPLGLAAGFDKNAQAVDVLLALGFVFVEVDSVTPVLQDGNPQPRIFRLSSAGAIINRCGFNRDGIVVVAKWLGAQHDKRKLDATSSTSTSSNKEVNQTGKAGPGILGVNLGKNKTSKDAAADYVQGSHATWKDRSIILEAFSYLDHNDKVIFPNLKVPSFVDSLSADFVSEFPASMIGLASVSEIFYLKILNSVYNYMMRGTSTVVFHLRLKHYSVSYFIELGVWCMLDENEQGLILPSASDAAIRMLIFFNIEFSPSAHGPIKTSFLLFLPAMLLIVMKTEYTSLQVAAIFMATIVRLHGIPKSIVFDRDKVFTSKLWQQLFKLQCATPAMSSDNSGVQDISEATWEDFDMISQHYPHFNLEDKVDFNGGSNVTNQVEEQCQKKKKTKFVIAKGHVGHSSRERKPSSLQLCGDIEGTII